MFILLVGLAAGIIGTAGGITSLVSYPGLILAGLSPLTANVANLVAMVATWPSSAASSRRELHGSTRELMPLVISAACGGVLGTALLLTTSAIVFEQIVPVLVLVGSASLLSQPAITRWREKREAQRSPVASAGWVALISIYGGYFGAGSGVMLLTACLVLVTPHLPVANAVKNMLVGAAALTTAALMILFVDVPWSAVLPLGIGLFLGGLLGPRVARVLPATAVRWTVALMGVVLAVRLFLAA